MLNIRMRATRDGRNISGAERLSDATTAPDIARTLVARALHHPRGIPDDIHVTVRAVHPADIRHLTALPVTVRDTTTPAQAHAEVARLLSPGVLAALLGVVDLPGALLIDAASTSPVSSSTWG
ncbi:6-carboxyhexanoate--CoA ligase [Corynebacterium pollutisoli]|nr:6-carboxyhexanoate--CoA ligase [Corynebacterium pollutisoli]